MHRVCNITPAGTWNAASAIDRVILDADDRQRRRIVLTGEKGTQVLLEFDRPVTLRDGDGLVLDDGSVVLVAGEKEPLAEIVASSPEGMLRGLGAKVTAVEAPFDPQATVPHRHEYGHDHAHAPHDHHHRGHDHER
jgi:urease accessory protein